MGIAASQERPPPQKLILVPPLFERNLAGRDRMARSSYDVLFSKLSRSRLFEDYFHEQQGVVTRMMLQPPEDANVDIMVEMATPQGLAQGPESGWASFRWQQSEERADNWVDVSVATHVNKHVQARLCFFEPTYGIGSFAVLPILSESGALHVEPELGVRYGSPNLSAGVIATAGRMQDGPQTAWLVARQGRLTIGAQFRGEEGQLTGHSYSRPVTQASIETPLDHRESCTWPVNDCWCAPSPQAAPKPAPASTDSAFTLRDCDLALSYGTPGKGPLQPAFEFCVELLHGHTFSASYYHHLVVQRRVRNPLEDVDVVAITNYVDLGLEVTHRLEPVGESQGTAAAPSGIQMAAAWQVNKNVLLKAKLGSLASGVAVAFKSWWQPSFTFAVTAGWDHSRSKPHVGATFGIENFGGVRYERADPNYVMRTPTRTHAADPAILERYPLVGPKDGGAGAKPYIVPRHLQPGNFIL